MARIRTIKPEFWESESIASLSHSARLLFICCWNIADDSGRLRWNATYLNSQAFAYDELENSAVNEMMNELIKADLIVTYDAGEKIKSTYAYVINWRKHQVINRPQDSKYPEPPSDLLSENSNVNYSLNNSVSNSMNDSLLEGKGREGKRKGREGMEPQNFIVGIDKIKEEILGQMFLETTCMNMQYDFDQFKEFAERWINKKMVSGDYNYPVSKLKFWLCNDFEKAIKEGPGAKNSLRDNLNSGRKAKEVFEKSDMFDENGMLKVTNKANYGN
jgi:hypothetical protein